MFKVIKNTVLKKCYRRYIRSPYRALNHSTRAVLDSSPKIVVLLYHRILSGALYDPSDMTLSFETFVSQVMELSKRYPIISLGEAVHQMRENKRPHQVQVALTFDDGFQDNYDIVFPFLCENAIPATFFLTTDFIEKNTWQSYKNSFMTWAQVKEMSQKGMEIASHGVTHHSLMRLPHLEAVTEIQKSKEIIEQKLGMRCDHFAFPFGSKKDFNPALIQAVKKTGYQSCALNIHGYNRLNIDHFCFKRVIMDENIHMGYLLG